MVTMTTAALLAAGCCDPGDGHDGGVRDLAVNDLAVSDLAPLPDGLPVQPDLSPPPDLSPTDMPPLNRTRKVDLLFMIDNSSTMEASSQQLGIRFADFLKSFDDLAAEGTYVDLHVGVVTSDYGAGDKAGGGCQVYGGGQQGHLQARGVAADASCQTPVGKPFVAYDYDPAHAAANNLPAGQNLAATFTCMASVGASGCGFEHQLESVYAALHNTTDNAGFLRDEALLTIVFLTNEDDGSAPATAKFYENTADVGVVGPYDTYRQTRYGIVCSVPPAAPTLPPLAPSNGPLTCQPAPNPTGAADREFDVQRYIDFFTKPKSAGGVKNDPRDVALIAIDGPEAPTEVILAAKGTGLGLPPSPRYQLCGPTVSDNCLARLQHSCQNDFDTRFFGDPAVRLNTVVKSAYYHQLSSICGDNPAVAPDYSGTLAEAARMIRERVSP
jgi:hypothetical protein